VNRHVLGWLKSWDGCVFRRAGPVRRQDKHRSGAKVCRSGKRGRAAAADLTACGPQPEDPLGRPEKKVLLLAGPPGLGKTTLAHVLAHQAGYHVVEVNASDDRSAQVLKDKVSTATEHQVRPCGPRARRGPTAPQSVFGERRPNCVILDEVDGLYSGGAGPVAASTAPQAATDADLVRIPWT
jgi:chromosome transmission fidelity protein 18